MEGRQTQKSNIELPNIQHVKSEITSEPFPPLNSNRNIAALLSHSPPERSPTLPPIQRLGPSRPRNKSISKRGAHRKKNSRGSDWVRRLQNEGRLRPPNHGRKALSAEPSAEYGKRWEDLIDAATSATEDIDEDRTPVGSPRGLWLCGGGHSKLILVLDRFPNLPFQLIVPLCHHFRNPTPTCNNTGKVTKRLLSNKP